MEGFLEEVTVKLRNETGVTSSEMHVIRITLVR